MQLLELKLRLIIAGGFVSILGTVLFVVRGYATPFLGLLALGIVVLVVGLLWQSPRGGDGGPKDAG